MEDGRGRGGRVKRRERACRKRSGGVEWRKRESEAERKGGGRESGMRGVQWRERSRGRGAEGEERN